MKEIQTPKKETNKKKVCLYVDKDDYQKFQELCDKRDAPVSRVFNRFMKRQVEAI